MDLKGDSTVLGGSSPHWMVCTLVQGSTSLLLRGAPAPPSPEPYNHTLLRWMCPMALCRPHHFYPVRCAPDEGGIVDYRTDQASDHTTGGGAEAEASGFAQV
ncbi:unnamed protein product [Arctogadus glacialis]